MLKKNMLRYKIMELHMNLVKSGHYLEAKLILRLLLQGNLTLYLSDAEWHVECELEKLGCSISYSYTGNKSHVYL